MRDCISLAAAGVLALACCSPAQGDVHYVSKKGDPQYPYTIRFHGAREVQDAIDAADPGDTVLVDRGFYDGPVVVTEGVSLRGAGRGRTIISIPWVPDIGTETILLSPGAEVRGLTITCFGDCMSKVGVVALGGRVADCEIMGLSQGIVCTGARAKIEVADCALSRNRVEAIWVAGSRCEVLVHRCVISRNDGTGVSISGDVPVDVSLSECVIASNGRGIRVWEPFYDLRVDHCTVVHNDGPGLQADASWYGSLSIDSTIVWHNGGPDTLPSEALVTYSDLQCGWSGDGEGNILVDPGLVAWGPFDDSDNPIHVDGAYTGPADGTSLRPFGTIRGAVESYNAHLGYGSPCLGTGRNDTNMGAFPEEVPSVPPGATSVTVSVAAGDYYETPIRVPSGVRLLGAGPERSEVTAVGSSLFHMGADAALEGLTVHAETGVHCEGGSPSISNCAIHANWGVWCEESSPVITNSVMTRGVDERMGHAIVVYNSSPTIANCTLSQLYSGISVRDWDDKQASTVIVSNTIIWDMTPHHWDGGIDPIKMSYLHREFISVTHSNVEGGWPGEGNIQEDPRFVDREKGDFRLLPGSPCVDAGFNSPDLPERDIAGMHRIMFGGKSLSVDMGAYEFYINEVKPVPGTDQAIFTWTSLADKTYSIFYTDDLSNWQTAIDNFPSLGNQTTSWIDDGSLTGLPPSLVPRRFYRISENP